MTTDAGATGDGPPEVTFRERFRPPLRWLLLVLAGMTAATTVLSIGDTPIERLGWATAPVVFLAVTGSLTVLQVRDGVIYTSRRAGGRGLPVEELVDRRLVTGAALREVTARLTPSFRLHCPPWYRLGVQLITLDDDGERVEHLYGVRDAAAFLEAIDTPPASVDHHRQRGVPI